MKILYRLISKFFSLAFFPASSVSTTHAGLTAAAALYRNATSSMLQQHHQNSFSQYTSSSNEGQLSPAAVLAAASLNVRDVPHHQSLFPVPPPMFAPLYLNKETLNSSPQNIGTPSPFGIDSLRSIAVSVNEPSKTQNTVPSSNLPESSGPFSNPSSSSSTGKEAPFKTDFIRRQVDASNSHIPKQHSIGDKISHWSPECSCPKDSTPVRYV